MFWRRFIFISSLIAVFAMSFAAYAQQIPPNPNTSGIYVTSHTAINSLNPYVNAGEIDIENGGQLTNNGTINNSGNLVTWSGGLLINNGALNISNYLYNGGTLNNYGPLNIAAGQVENSGLLNNSSQLDNKAYLLNSSWASITGTGVYIQNGASGNNELINQGKMTQQSFQITSGTVNTAGTFTGAFTLGSTAIISNIYDPPFTNTLTINGSFYSSGAIQLNITPNGNNILNDSIMINGSAVFTGGNLTVDLYNSGVFTPRDGEYWDLLTANSITGWNTLSVNISFPPSSVGSGWEIETVSEPGGYVAERLLLTNVIPEPISLFLWCSGLFGLAMVRKKFRA